MPPAFQHNLHSLQTNAEREMRGTDDVLNLLQIESVEGGRIACVNCSTLFRSTGTAVLCFACASSGSSVATGMRREYNAIAADMREQMDICAACLPEFADPHARQTAMYTADLTGRCTNVACTTFCKRAHTTDSLARTGKKLARLSASGVRGELACTSRGRAGICDLDW